MEIKFIKPNWYNSSLTLVLLALPWLKEQVPLEEGGYVVEYYAPIVLLAIYTWMLDVKPFFLMLLLAVFIYLVSSLVVFGIQNLLKLFKK